MVVCFGLISVSEKVAGDIRQNSLFWFSPNSDRKLIHSHQMLVETAETLNLYLLISPFKVAWCLLGIWTSPCIYICLQPDLSGSLSSTSCFFDCSAVNLRGKQEIQKLKALLCLLSIPGNNVKSAFIGTLRVIWYFIFEWKMNATGQGMLKKDDLISVYVVVMVTCWVDLYGSWQCLGVGTGSTCLMLGRPRNPRDSMVWDWTRHLSSGDTFPTKRCVPRQGTKVYVFFSQLSTDVMYRGQPVFCEPGNAH